MNAWEGCNNRIISQEEQHLYNHWLACVNTNTPEQLVDRFRALFIEGTGYPERDIAQTLDAILASRHVEHYFQYILNRCCHILINRWQSRPHCHTAIVDLVQLFESGPSNGCNEFSRARSVRRLREIVATFPQTEQYLALNRMARVMSHAYEGDCHGNRPLGTLIQRYPYLYEHCLVTEDSTQEHQQNVRRIQAEAQYRFEIDLSQYVTYRVRRSRMRRQGSSESAERILRPIQNPTLLNDRDLVQSIKHFSGSISDSGSYKDQAQRFLRHNTRSATYRTFKRDLYEYITASLDADYGARQFNNALYKQLMNLYPDSDSQLMSDFLMVRTFSQLFNFLVVDSPKQPQHFVFVDLITNVGALVTTGLLLKLLLLCQKVRPYLERRFSILFNHYESTARDSVSWLVQVLENLNVALSLNFGTVDLSHVL